VIHQGPQQYVLTPIKEVIENKNGINWQLIHERHGKPIEVNIEEGKNKRDGSNPKDGTWHQRFHREVNPTRLNNK
jgi:hypothetical protein